MREHWTLKREHEGIETGETKNARFKYQKRTSVVVIIHFSFCLSKSFSLLLSHYSHSSHHLHPTFNNIQFQRCQIVYHHITFNVRHWLLCTCARLMSTMPAYRNTRQTCVLQSTPHCRIHTPLTTHKRKASYIQSHGTRLHRLLVSTFVYAIFFLQSVVLCQLYRRQSIFLFFFSRLNLITNIILTVVGCNKQITHKVEMWEKHVLI